MTGCLVASASWLPAAQISHNGKEASFLGGSSSNLLHMYCRCECQECSRSTASSAPATPIPTPPGRVFTLLDFYRHVRATSTATADKGEGGGPTPANTDADDETACWQNLMYKSAFIKEEVKLRQHAIDVAVSQGTRALLGKKLFVYHFPPGVDKQPLLRGGWMRGGIKCYIEATGEYLISYDNRSTGTLYLGLNFTHFSTRPPLPGSQPQLLPSTDPTPGKRKRVSDADARVDAAAAAAGVSRRALPRPPVLQTAQLPPKPAKQLQRRLLGAHHAEEDESTVSEHDGGSDDGGEAAVSSGGTAARPGQPGQLGAQQPPRRRQHEDDDDEDDGEGGAGSRAGPRSMRVSAPHHLQPSATPSPHDIYSAMAGLPLVPGGAGWPAAAGSLDLAALLAAGVNNPHNPSLFQAAAAAMRNPQGRGMWYGAGLQQDDLTALQQLQQLAEGPPKQK